MKRGKPHYLNKHPQEKKKKKIKKQENDEEISKAIEKVSSIDFILDAHRCEICNQEISKSVMILCADCGMLICLQCLANGKEKGDHKRTDDYYPLNRLRHPLYSAEWSALEELMLIRGIEKYGVDNWAEIADYLGTKTANECEVHYYSFYYKSSEEKCPSEEDIIIERDETGEVKTNDEKHQASLEKISKFLLQKEEKIKEEQEKRIEEANSNKTQKGN